MGGWGRGMGRKVIWHAHGWFFLYVNVVSPWLMFSPSVIALEVNVSIAVNLFSQPLLLCSVVLSVFILLLLFLFFCLGSTDISPSWAPESFCLFGVFPKAVWFQASVPLSQLSDNWDKPSLGLYAFKSLRCQSTLSIKQTKHAVNHSCWEAGITAGLTYCIHLDGYFTVPWEYTGHVYDWWSLWKYISYTWHCWSHTLLTEPLRALKMSIKMIVTHACYV